MTVTSSTSLWIASRTLLAEHGEKFFSQWGKAAQTFEEEDVHDFRVASRRLREALALFEPCLAPKKKRRLARQVKRVTRMLGDLRNIDEAFAFFSGLTDAERKESEEEAQALLTALRGEREQAHLKLRAELEAFDPAPLRAEFEALHEDGNLFARDSHSFTGFSSFAAGALLEREKPVSELLGDALQEENGQAQHQLRIAVKKLRYRLEILEPVITRDYNDLRGMLKEYQDVLGKLHDLDVFSSMVRERVRNGSGKRSLIDGMAQRRKNLYVSFRKLLEKTPVDEVGAKARDALQPS